MPQPDTGIPVDTEKVLHRAYARIGDLTMQIDQLVVALELARPQGGRSTGEPAATPAAVSPPAP